MQGDTFFQPSIKTVKHVSIQPVSLHKILVPQQVLSIEIDGDFAVVKCKQGIVHVDLGSATVSSAPNFRFLKKIALTAPEGSFSLAGISVAASLALEAAVQEARRRKILLKTFQEQAELATAPLSAWEALISRDAYLTHSDIESWGKNNPALLIPSDTDLIERLPKDLQFRFMNLLTISGNPQRAADQHNAKYAVQQLAAFQDFFDTVESNPLTKQQREAIVHDDDNALVIAGAGTGKTSTVVGKVGFILRKGWATPDEILLLAFTQKAATEMRGRIKRKLGVDVKVRTFHGLGVEIIAQAQGKKPSLCPEAEDPRLKAQTIQDLITDLLADNGFRRDLLAFKASLRRAFKSAWEFKSEREYLQYLIDVEPRTLSGRLVKSYEECEIANWLTTHGIAFDYERPYDVDTATIEFRQYKPDFFLPKHGIYIEHLGVDRNGNAPPFIDPNRYRAKMQWAREQHAKHQTTLVETYSWERKDGVLLTSLEAKLRERGVVPYPISADAALEILNTAGRVDPLVTLVGTFLSLFKSGGQNVIDISKRAERGGETARAMTFLKVFAKIHAAYEAMLQERGEIDFDDMISHALGAVKNGTFSSRFRYLIVDEFQDIAAGRATLIQALRNQVAGAKLFCVGDDWQSIYRFTGSDISITTEFERHFGFTRRTTLDRTFRFNDKIANFSSRFVQRNPSQIRKQLSTLTSSTQSGVVVSLGEDDTSSLESILTEIAAQGEASVFILSRYKHTAPKSLTDLQARFSRLKMSAMTAHSSKGLEADFVVIVGLSQGKYGFPSEIADDPVLGMVLPEGEQFDFAEERRLFYVALTRARRRVYLIADAANPSTFVREIIADASYEKEVLKTAAASSGTCPVCERGKAIRREGNFGFFYSCSNYPICTHRWATCSRCKRGKMQGDDGEAVCSDCGFQATICPRCHLGVLIVRNNKKSGHPFRGCSTYGQLADSCNYTERIVRQQVK